MKIFAIRDESTQEQKDLAYLLYYKQEKQFYIELPENADAWETPLLLDSFVKRGETTVNSYWSMQQSGVDILEPMLYFELQIPQAASSKAITDLQKMMSEIEDISCNNEWCHIKGKVPLNTSKDYASEVSSYTKGLGVFMVKPCGYQITKGDYSDNIRMNEKDKLLFMFQKSIYELIQNKKKI